MFVLVRGNGDDDELGQHPDPQESFAGVCFLPRTSPAIGDRGNRERRPGQCEPENMRHIEPEGLMPHCSNGTADGFGFPDLSLFEFHRFLNRYVCVIMNQSLLPRLGALHGAGGVFGTLELSVG